MLETSSSTLATCQSMLVTAFEERWDALHWTSHLSDVLENKDSKEVAGVCAWLLETSSSMSSFSSSLLTSLRHLFVVRRDSLTVGTIIEALIQVEEPSTEILQLTHQLLQQPQLNHNDCGECGRFTRDLLSLLHWLLRVLHRSINQDCTTTNKNLYNQGMSSKRSRVTSLSERREQRRREVMKAILELIVQNDLMVSLLRINDSERNKESDLDRLLKHMNQLEDQLVGGPLDFSLSSITTALRSALLSSGSSKGLSSATYNSDQVLSNVTQPLLLILKNEDPSTIASRLYSLCKNGNCGQVSYNQLAKHVLLSSLQGIDLNTTTMESLGWDCFILLKLPSLLDNLARLYSLPETLKTPTQLFLALDALLEHETLLNAVDDYCEVDVIDLMIGGLIDRVSRPLITDTEAEDVRKKRRTAKKVTTERSAKISVVKRQRDRRLKAVVTAEAMIENLIRAMDKERNNGREAKSVADSIENVLGLLVQLISDDRRLDLILATANSCGSLRSLSSQLIAFNSLCQESQGESVKNSLLRSALYDVTFLIIVYIAISFGVDVIIDSNHPPVSYLQHFVLEEVQGDVTSAANVKNTEPFNIENVADTILQQMQAGELRTQVVKWQNVLSSMKTVTDEIILASVTSRHLSASQMKSMVTTAFSKLASVALCVVSCVFNQRQLMPINDDTFVQTMVNLALNNCLQSSNGDVPFVPERKALCKRVLVRLLAKHKESNWTSKKNLFGAQMSHETLKELQHRVWISLTSQNVLTASRLSSLRNLMRLGGAEWFVKSFSNELLSTVYSANLLKERHLLLALFHIDVKRCAQVLLTVVLPSYIESHSDVLSDPHGSTLASLTTELISSSPYSLEEALIKLFKTLNRVVMNTFALTPCILFTIQLLNEASKSSIKHPLLQHVQAQPLARLLHLAPEHFDYNFIKRIFKGQREDEDKQRDRTAAFLIMLYKARNQELEH